MAILREARFTASELRTVVVTHRQEGYAKFPTEAEAGACRRSASAAPRAGAQRSDVHFRGLSVVSTSGVSMPTRSNYGNLSIT